MPFSRVGPLYCPSREWTCGRVGVQSVVAFVCECVCACLLLIGRGVPQYRVATFLNQLKNSSTSSRNDREEKLPPPVEVSMYLTLYIIEKWYSESFKVIRRWCVFIFLPLNLILNTTLWYPSFLFHCRQTQHMKSTDT